MMKDDIQGYEQMLERRRHAEDVAAVVHSPEGRRILMEMLRRWGAGLPVGATEAERALRNEAELLLGRIMRAAPQAGVGILQELYGGK